MKRGGRAAVAAVLAVTIAASMPSAMAASKRRVVASFYPLAYAAQRVGDGRVDVSNLTPAGAEPHDLELTPDQIDHVLDADVMLELGHNFQPAVEKSAAQRDGPTVRVLDQLAAAKAHPNDPHVWLDPVLMQALVTQVARSLTKADPAHRTEYARNARALRSELAALDVRYRYGLGNCARNLIVTAHEAFGYLARRYGLRQEGVAGLSPDDEPDPKRIGELADLARREHATVVFTEELVSPRIADTLAREAGVRTAVLNPLEGLTDRERRAGANYVTVMDDNLRTLRRALGCK
jgi:zinc transport system substrate-binding protein